MKDSVKKRRKRGAKGATDPDVVETEQTSTAKPNRKKVSFG